MKVGDHVYIVRRSGEPLMYKNKTTTRPKLDGVDVIKARIRFIPERIGRLTVELMEAADGYCQAETTDQLYPHRL